MAEDPREYPSRPLVGVGGLIVDENGRVLLVKRAFDPGKGLWAVPGGTPEVGETLKEALVREVEEETGVKIQVEKLIDVFDLIVNDEKGKVRYHFVLVDFLAKPLTGEVRPSFETPEVRWVGLKELKNYPLTATTRRLINLALEKGILKGGVNNVYG
ncbi:hypothetical protein DRO53_03395 [Candidatus Bathyarchaeota archaeon]|nr:MAG: hypothetical protein DRO46_01140 [Candidatus Hecatellales archaeon]RLI34482.1 MAG: hypothetical protein DRO53_03395 [Candidatus Bathyarchaeota archaeon]